MLTVPEGGSGADARAHLSRYFGNSASLANSVLGVESQHQQAKG